MTDFVAIAPIQHLEEIETQPRFLALMHLMGDPAYEYFFQQRSDNGQYVILDNSQHEGYNFDVRDIIRKAEWIGAQEIVIPDAVEDRLLTVDRAKAAFALMVLDRVAAEVLEGLRPHIMVVPQGANVTEWERCLRDLIRIYEKIQSSAPSLFPHPLVIGFPAQYCFNVFSRKSLERVLSVLSRHPNQVHILGWDSTPWHHVPWLIEQFPFRSVDTAKPFSFACFSDEVPLIKRHRSSNFFHERLTPKQLLQARLFLKEFKGMVRESNLRREGKVE